jgi:hypothetical protein
MNKDNFEKEWNEIKKISLINGYSINTIENLLYNKVKKVARDNVTSLQSSKSQASNFISVPFYPPLTNKISKILKKYDIQLSYSNFGKTQDVLGSMKDKVDDLKKSGIYMIECADKDCDKLYIGQTKRTLEIREKEHKNLDSRSAVAQHQLLEFHPMKNIKLLKSVDRADRLDGWESYYLYKYRDRELLNENKFGNLMSSLYDFG